MLGWNEIETRAVTFQKTWRNCTGDERQEAQSFEKDFMNVFGVDWHDGLHEHQIMLLDGSIGYIDYFLPGKILVEMKSKGKSLATAYTQAMSYVHALKPDEIPVLVVVCDFNKMNVYIFIKMKISGNCEMWKRRGASHFFGLLQMRIKKPGFPGFRVMTK